jgi:hypothetical protein
MLLMMPKFVNFSKNGLKAIQSLLQNNVTWIINLGKVGK